MNSPPRMASPGAGRADGCVFFLTPSQLGVTTFAVRRSHPLPRWICGAAFFDIVNQDFLIHYVIASNVARASRMFQQ